jgi:hypothetical protein
MFICLHAIGRTRQTVRQLSVLYYNMGVGDEMEGAMEEEPNVCPVVNQAPRHETVRSRAGAPSLILTTSALYGHLS